MWWEPALCELTTFQFWLNYAWTENNPLRISAVDLSTRIPRTTFHSNTIPTMRCNTSFIRSVTRERSELLLSDRHIILCGFTSVIQQETLTAQPPSNQLANMNPHRFQQWKQQQWGQPVQRRLDSSPLLVLEKILMLVGEELDEERKIPLKLRRRGDLGGEFW